MRSPEPSGDRGAVSNLPGRYAIYTREAFDDGWGSLDDEDGRVPTTVLPESTKKILTTNDSPDIPFAQSINPYKGCEHGCVYCFARPTHSYLDLSPGIDFETKIFSKPDAAALLRRELAKPGYECRSIALGTNTDPYQPTERTLGITRAVLEVLADCRHPFSIVTKSNLVLRDLDLIAPAAAAGRAAVFLSVTTLDRRLARTMEPRAATPLRRLDAIRGLASSGIPTGVMVAPVVPALTDGELESILEASRDAGARVAGYLLLRLPFEVKPLFLEWLEERFPERAAKVRGRIEAMRGGRLNDPRFGSRMRGEGPFADLLARRFRIAATRLGFESRPAPLDTAAFRAPGGIPGQGRLF